VIDFVPITGLGKGGQVLVVRPDAPYKSVADLVAFAKKNPGKLTFGSGSSSSRVAGEMLKQLAGVDILHVPYKSNPMALTDVLGGQIDFMITDTATGAPQVKAGKLRALGVSTLKRIPLLPDVPTIDEAGVKGYDMSFWFAAYVPAGTPPAVVSRLNELLVAATRSTPARAYYESSGVEAWSTTSDELAKFQAADTVKWGKVVKAAGIEPE
jgi:tripartite-type tricarboxylate transporter receptor subunit TctC